MIKLEKGPEPEILKKNKVKWTEELLNFVKLGSKIPDNVKDRYNCNEVKCALKEETHGKCMYCESVVDHVAYNHIEHYKPKNPSKYPDLTFEWENLGLACPICNGNKSDTFDETCAFVNPYYDDPNDFFRALGPIIYPICGNSRSFITEKIIDLNRNELVERRKERIDLINSLIDRYKREDNNLHKKIIREEIEIEIGIDKPYSMSAKSFVKAMI